MKRRNKIKVSALMTLPLLYGNNEMLFVALTILAAISLISNLIVAIVLKRCFLKEICFHIVELFGILLIIVMAATLDLIIDLGSIKLCTITISYYIAYEGLSILNNWNMLKLPLPPIIKKVLTKL